MCEVIAIFSVSHFMIAKYYYLASVISITNKLYCCFICQCSHKPCLQDTPTADYYQGRPVKKGFQDVYKVLVGLDSDVPGIKATLHYYNSLDQLETNERIKVRKRTRRENVQKRKIYKSSFCEAGGQLSRKLATVFSLLELPLAQIASPSMLVRRVKCSEKDMHLLSSLLPELLYQYFTILSFIGSKAFFFCAGITKYFLNITAEGQEMGAGGKTTPSIIYLWHDLAKKQHPEVYSFWKSSNNCD